MRQQYDRPFRLCSENCGCMLISAARETRRTPCLIAVKLCLPLRQGGRPFLRNHVAIRCKSSISFQWLDTNQGCVYACSLPCSSEEPRVPVGHIGHSLGQEGGAGGAHRCEGWQFPPWLYLPWQILSVLFCGGMLEACLFHVAMTVNANKI